MSLPTFAEIDREGHHQRPHSIVVECRNRRGETVGVYVGAHEARVGVYKADGGVGCGEMIHAERGHGDGVPVGV